MHSCTNKLLPSFVSFFVSSFLPSKAAAAFPQAVSIHKRVVLTLYCLLEELVIYFWCLRGVLAYYFYICLGCPRDGGGDETNNENKKMKNTDNGNNNDGGRRGKEGKKQIIAMDDDDRNATTASRRKSTTKLFGDDNEDFSDDDSDFDELYSCLRRSLLDGDEIVPSSSPDVASSSLPTNHEENHLQSQTDESSSEITNKSKKVVQFEAKRLEKQQQQLTANTGEQKINTKSQEEEDEQPHSPQFTFHPKIVFTKDSDDNSNNKNSKHGEQGGGSSFAGERRNRWFNAQTDALILSENEQQGSNESYIYSVSSNNSSTNDSSSGDGAASRLEEDFKISLSTPKAQTTQVVTNEETFVKLAQDLGLKKEDATPQKVKLQVLKKEEKEARKEREKKGQQEEEEANVLIENIKEKMEKKKEESESPWVSGRARDTGHRKKRQAVTYNSFALSSKEVTEKEEMEAAATEEEDEVQGGRGNGEQNKLRYEEEARERRG
jgi:hypothetical protein